MNSDLKLVGDNGAPPPLPIAETLKMVFEFYKDNALALVRVAVIPVLMMLCVIVIFDLLDQSDPQSFSVLTLLSSLITSAIMSMVLASVGRMALFGDVPQGLAPPAFGRDERLTWAASILTSIIAIIGAGVPALVVYVLTQSPALAVLTALVSAIAASIFLIMVYPLVLVTGRVNPRLSARMTKGSFFQIFAVVFAASLVTVLAALVVMSIVLGVVGALTGTGIAKGAGAEQVELGTLAATIAALLSVVMQVFIASVNIVVASFAFRWIDYYSPDPLLKSEEQ